MNILVVAEHDNLSLKGETLNTVTAATQIGGNVDLLIVGENCGAVAEQSATITGVNRVLVADHMVYAHQLAENLSLLVTEIASDYSHILAPATTNGKNFMPRVAATLSVSQISEIISVESSDTFKRPIYAGNAIATVQSSDVVKVITVRSTGFDCASYNGGATIVSINKVLDAGLSSFVSEVLAQSDRPGLTSAKVIISGGRGMGSSSNFGLLDSVANKLGAALGASRAAVDAGYAPNDMQVGQTGKIVAPELYIAVGISGAIQHLAGMKDSKVIVAINKDEEAPIFQVADYGLVGDLFDVIPEMSQAI